MSSSSSDTSSSETCPICEGTLSEGVVVQVREKGAAGINSASGRRGDGLVVAAGCRVHVKCRLDYTNEHNIKKAVKAGTSGGPVDHRRSARLSAGTFNSRTDCLFCGTHVNLKGSGYFHVRTDNFSRTISNHCDSRSDDWATQVKGRIEYLGDLHAADCIYHSVCSANFRSGFNVPLRYQDASSCPAVKRRKVGRPKDADQEQAFFGLCAFLDMNDEEQFTMADLHGKMKEFLKCDDSTPYDRQYLKSKLIEHYGDTMFISERCGVSNTVSFKETASDILRSFYRNSKAQCDEETQKRAMIDTAARLILSDIKHLDVSSTEYYPKVEDLPLDSALDFIPETLRDLLTKIFAGKQWEVASIGQAIVQAARPRTVFEPDWFSSGDASALSIETPCENP